MIIGQGEIKMDKKKLEAIEKWKPPTSVKEIRSFTGFTNFYRKFIPDFSNIVAPLNLLTCKGEHWIWTQLQQRAFKRLKHIFSSIPVLRIPDVTCPFSIMTDASLLVAGAVLMQADENSNLHPCAYFSCTFSSAQHNYDIYDHELLVLQDFNIRWQVTPGTKMAPADVLSRRDHIDTTQDNQEMAICPEPVIIQALDLALAQKI